jgi:hypothetical protein
MKSISTLLIIILFNIHSFAAQPLWTKDFKTNINWQKVTSLGQLVASTGKGLMGISPATGDMLWNIEELKNCPENSYQSIPSSPFIGVSPADGSKAFYIVDPLEGKIVFNSKTAGIEQVNDRYFLYENNKILVIGTTTGGKGTEMVMVDMGSGKKLWSKGGAYTFVTGCRDLPNNEVLLTSAFFASKLNANTGEELWKTSLDPKAAGMTGLLGMLEGFAAKKLTKDDIMAQLITTPDAPGIFIVAAQKKNESTKTDSKGNKTVTITYTSVYMAFETATGKHKWGSVVEMKFPLGISYTTPRGLLVCSSSDGNINMLSYADGSRLLGKKGNGLGLKGPAMGVAPMGDGKLIMVSDAGRNSAITLLDPATGEFLFDKAVKIKGTVSYTEMLPSGVLVGTGDEVNLLNTTSGEWYWDNGIDGGASLIAGNDQGIYVFNTKDKLLYRMDVTGTAIKAFSTTPVEFQGKEKPTALEITSYGILLSSEQNLALYDTKGGVVYNQYYPAPGISDFRKALLIASAVRAAYYSAAFATYSAAFGAASQSIQVKDSRSKATKEVTADISRAFGDATVTGVNYTAQYIKMAQQRFKATTQTQDYMLVMTSETKKDAKLLQVSKADGKIKNTIWLGRDKDPVYDVDMVEGKLYYLKDGGKMEGYQF